MKLLQDRTAIITGGGTPGGIGRATARLFAEHGARVAILDIEATDPAAAAAEVGHQKLRPPLAPVTLGELAALDPGQLGNMGHTGDTGPRDHAAREANR